MSSFLIYNDNPLLFYDLTIDEVITYIKSKNKVHEANKVDNAISNFALANHLGNLVGIVVGGKGTPPKFEDTYSYILTDEHKKEIEERKQQLEIDRIKASMMLYAEANNRRRQERSGESGE